MKTADRSEPESALDSTATAAAKQAGLHYVGDHLDGIARVPGRNGFSYRGPDGKVVRDKATLARIIRRTRDLPGQELFQYVDDDGNQCTVGSSDVNDYLRKLTGEDYTVKDFRTWSGTVFAALVLQEYEKFDSQAQAKKNIVRAIESVAQKLGNTPSVCRKCYVHPAVIESYLDGSMLEALRQRAREELADDVHALRAEEAAVLGLLQQRLQMENPAATRKSSGARHSGSHRQRSKRDTSRHA